LRVPFSPQTGKRVMSEEDFRELIDGEVVIEEKLDGATYCIEIEEEPNLYFFGEYLKIKHSVSYDRIPIPEDSRFLWYVIFDIYEKVQKRFLTPDEKREYAEVYGFPIAPLLYKGKIKEEDISPEDFIKKLARSISHMGPNLMEGVVIKNYQKQRFGKYINEEFRIEVHYRDKILEENKMDPKPSHPCNCGK
ncbi:MAG: hypothetical protein N2746_12400, partial [Deltaproteobacteria bacterium]|nr:hypothetical protein [Deltaproteobacteria bacterium]